MRKALFYPYDAPESLGASVRALGPRGGICTRVRHFHECGTLVGAALERLLDRVARSLVLMVFNGVA
jgi:hypothetical protein